MSNALRVVQRLIEDGEDDFDVKSDLLSPNAFDVYAPHWEFVKAKAREAMGRMGKVDPTSYLFRNRHADFYTKVYSEWGDESFTVVVYDEAGDYVDATHIEVPDAKSPWDALPRAFPAAMDLIKDYSITLWRKAAMGT